MSYFRIVTVALILTMGMVMQAHAAVGPLVYETYVVDDDNAGNSSGNSNGIVSAGETIELYVYMFNDGGDMATSVNVCLSEDSPYVNGFLYNDCSTYGDILGGGIATNTNDFDFTVDPSAPSGHVINFTLTISASNGGPWSDTFSIRVVNNRVGLISDTTELTAITPILDDMAGLDYEILNNNWDGSQGVYTSDYSVLSDYDVVIWYASGNVWGREITQDEHDTLELYLQYGGRLLITGYDTLGSPNDPLLADLVRSSSYGDGPFTYDYTVTDGSHPIMSGPFGSFPTGTALVAGYSDHDQAEADTGRGAVTVAELSDGHDKIIATDMDPAYLRSGRVVYWNGNANVWDWAGYTATASLGIQSQALTEDKQGSGGLITNESLVSLAKRLDPAEVPPEANYDGAEPILQLDPDTLSAIHAQYSDMTSQSITFIATGDTVSVNYYPYWWHTGDYAEGVRILNLDTVDHVDYTLTIGTNYLTSTGHVDLDLSINGTVVGSFTVLPGELTKNVSFSFSPIAGPTYTIRLEETNTVDSGCGSITLPADVSTMVLSASQADILRNSISWLTEGAGKVLSFSGYLVDDDNLNNSAGNNNQRIDPGETIELYVTLKNTGPGNVTGISASISSDDPFVTFIYNTSSSYPDIPAGGSGTNSDDFDFEVNPACPIGHIINFSLVINSNEGSSTDSFQIQVDLFPWELFLPAIIKKKK